MLIAMALIAASPGGLPPGDPGQQSGPWVTNDDYPAAARRAGWEGTVHFRLDIDAEGRPTACEVTQSSGHAVLDDATCPLLMRRARFNPARDENGTAVAGSWSSKFTWSLER